MAHRASTVDACFSKAALALGLMAFGDAHQSYPPWFTLRLFFGLVCSACGEIVRCAFGLSSLDAIVWSIGLPLPRLLMSRLALH